jgi:hypothetical protein
MLILLLISSTVFSRTNCPPAKVTHIQIEGSVVLYAQEGSTWRRLGDLREVGTTERYSALLAAQFSGKRVMVAYLNDNYDCDIANYSDPAYIVRTFNQ